MPIVNLISNIGFGVDSTHTTGCVVLLNLMAEEIGFILKHPDIFRKLSFGLLGYQDIYSILLLQKLKKQCGELSAQTRILADEKI